jgi:hypothetical protein
VGNKGHGATFPFGFGMGDQAKRREWTGKDLIGSTRKTDSGCSRQDRTPLSTSSSTPRQGSRTSRRRTDRIQSGADPVTPQIVDAPRFDHARVVSVVALAILVGLTSWAIASVASWLVGVYASVMVLIFTLPRKDGANRGCDQDRNDRSGVRTKWPEEARRVRRDARDGATQDNPAAVSTATSDNIPPSAAPATPVKRSRSRTRKAVKPSAEPAAEPALASWLQVAPGKFVRADAQQTPVSPLPEPHAPIEVAETSVGEADQEPDQTDEPPPIAAPAHADGDPIHPVVETAVDLPPTEELLATVASIALSEPSDSGESLTEQSIDPAPAVSDDEAASRLVQYRVSLVRTARHASSKGRRASSSHGLRNVSSGTIRTGSGRLGPGAGARWRARRSRSSGRLSKTNRRFLPRSPPRRS